MRRAAASLACLLMTCGVARAADPPPLRGAIFYPTTAPFDWTGFYVGANLGGGLGNAETDFSVGAPAFGIAKNSLAGAAGGVQAGFNWQRGPTVLGIEADFQLTSLHGSLDAPCPPGGCLVPLSASFGQTMPWFGTVRGRLGYAAGTWLAYATAGYAYGRFDSEANASAAGVGLTLTQSETRSGWTVGAGIEVAFFQCWSARIESLYVDFGSARSSWALPGLPAVAGDARLYANITRGGLNYRF